jgi:hypothetical protein
VPSPAEEILGAPRERAPGSPRTPAPIPSHSDPHPGSLLEADLEDVPEGGNPYWEILNCMDWTSGMGSVNVWKALTVKSTLNRHHFE